MRSFKYTNSKGTSINIGPNSVPTTLDDNLGSYWNANTLPDYPDNPSGTTYLQDTWTTVDGWATQNGTPTLATTGNGTLLYTQGSLISGLMYKTLSISSGKSIQLRIKRLSGTAGRIIIENETTVVYDSGVGVDKLITGQWVTLNIYIGAYSFTTIKVTPMYGASSGNQCEIDYIYIGDGTYSSKLIDISGDWNFLNVYGCTPVTGSNGKALSFNGINNYLRSSSTLTSIPDVWRFHIRFPFGLAQSSTNMAFFMYRTQTTVGHLNIGRAASSNYMYISYSDGSTVRSSYFNDLFSGFSSIPIALDMEFNFSSQAATLSGGSILPAYNARVYRNGIIFATNILTTPVKPAAGDYLYIGSYAGTAHFLSAIAEGFAIGSGALTAAEHWALYSNYSAPFKATGETSYGIVESVEGIDYSDSDLQTTKAPYQDGETYLDTLLSSRDVTIEGIIPVPVAIDTINAHRKAMLDIFNAKYGLGKLDYYYGLNTIQHRVLKNVTVNSVKFANRVMPEPTQRYQIAFTAHDPYFYESQFSPYAIDILSGSSRTLTVGGENDTPCFIRIYGAATNPTITNVTTGETLSLTYTLAAGSYIDIDTTFGNKTVLLNGVTNLIGYVDLSSTFFQLPIGSPVLSYSGGGDITVMWYNKYIGV